MHNMDRTQLESGAYGSNEYDEFGLGLGGNMELPMYGEIAMDEVEEIQWATELLAVTNEGELDEFLGNFFRKFAPRLKTAFAPVVQAVAPKLKDAAKTAIPLAGQALGSLIGTKSAIVGKHLGNAAVDILGWEIGDQGDGESFEAARQIVRFGADAIRRAGAVAASGQTSPQALAQAVNSAAKTHAPGLLATAGRSSAPQSSGRWVRRGNRIILIGV